MSRRIAVDGADPARHRRWQRRAGRSEEAAFSYGVSRPRLHILRPRARRYGAAAKRLEIFQGGFRTAHSREAVPLEMNRKFNTKGQRDKGSRPSCGFEGQSLTL